MQLHKYRCTLRVRVRVAVSARVRVNLRTWERI